jgi:hypothetical protein
MTATWIPAARIDIDGPYSQNVIGTQVSGDVVQNQNTFVRGQPPMHLSMGEVADRMACYVLTRNHKAIVRELHTNRAVVIAGRRGSGRETTAIAAIRQLRPDIQFRRFSLEDEDTEEIRMGRACGYLVHAEDGGLTRLGRCAEVVRAHDGYLAVIAEREIWVAPELINNIQLEHPDPFQVYQSHVTFRGLDGWASWEKAADLLNAALPADARRLADLVTQVGRRQASDVTTQRAEVVHAFLGWDEELRDWFSAHSEPHERALLVAAATVPSAAPEAYVYDAASLLAHRLEIDINGRGLAWCPVTGLRTLLGANRTDGPIVFGRAEYARSVLRHALTDYPLARADMLAWLAALPTGEAASYGVANPVAETFADLAAEHGTAEDITKAARGWGDADHADLAFIALSRTCLHPRVGARIRRILYEWSRTVGTRQTLKLTIARVCEPLGQTYPSIALTRLKHLATHSNTQLVGEVIVTAQALAAQGHHEEVLRAALDWCAQINRENLSDQARQRRRRAGARLFLELARSMAPAGLPQILDGQRAADPASCMPGWRAILDFRTEPGLPVQEIEGVLGRWLDATVRFAHIRQRICAVFIAAATPPLIPSSKVNGLTPPQFDSNAARFMIDVVQRWAALDPDDTGRGEIEEYIVIPLTRPWWLRLIKTLYMGVRGRRRAN